MAEDGNENIFDDRDNYHRGVDEASEEDAIVDDEVQSDPDEEMEGKDLDENLEE